MANTGYIAALLLGIDRQIRRPLQLAFLEATEHHALGGESKAKNFDWYRIESTTAATANSEFAVAHGLAKTPKWLLPVMDLASSVYQLVPLAVTRPADSVNLYLKSSSTGAIFRAFVE